MKIQSLLFLFATLFAASAPALFSASGTTTSATSGFPGWPEFYEDSRLSALDVSEKERVFSQGFPGEIGRFSDGERELIVRWVQAPTRRLHPAADCFKGVGYALSPLPVQHNLDGVAMGCFTASRESQTLKVCEYIAESWTTGNGETWSDVSSWYWQNILADHNRGWWSVVVAENR